MGIVFNLERLGRRLDRCSRYFLCVNIFRINTLIVSILLLFAFYKKPAKVITKNHGQQCYYENYGQTQNGDAIYL